METGTKFQFSAEALTLANKIIKRYPEGKSKSALLPLLHIAQGENQGWLSVAAMDYVADFLKIQPIEVYEVASFYTMYNLKPVGKYVLEVCRTGPCCLNGAEDVIDYLQNKLGIKVGETTPDGKFTIKTVECLASCGSAPMMQVGMYYHENLNKEKIEGLLEEFGK
jgi:NADH-quinone oxidoreductase subunit E